MTKRGARQEVLRRGGNVGTLIAHARELMERFRRTGIDKFKWDAEHLAEILLAAEGINPFRAEQGTGKESEGEKPRSDDPVNLTLF